MCLLLCLSFFQNFTANRLSCFKCFFSITRIPWFFTSSKTHRERFFGSDTYIIKPGFIRLIWEGLILTSRSLYLWPPLLLFRINYYLLNLSCLFSFLSCILFVNYLPVFGSKLNFWFASCLAGFTIFYSLVKTDNHIEMIWQSRNPQNVVIALQGQPRYRPSNIDWLSIINADWWSLLFSISSITYVYNGYSSLLRYLQGDGSSSMSD